MNPADFVYDWPLMALRLFQIWIFFGTATALLFYLDKPFNRFYVYQWLFRSFFFSLGLWVMMIFMGMLYWTVNGAGT